MQRVPVMSCRTGDQVSDRRIRTTSLEVDTPLVLPSFSSKGYSRNSDGDSDMPRDAEVILPRITGGVLLSAYDMHYGYLPDSRAMGAYPANPPYDAPEVIFVDSGGYEEEPRVDISGVLTLTSDVNPWSQDLLDEVLTTMDPRLPVVVVNLDLAGVPIRDQVVSAREFFDEHPHFGADCLMRASTRGDYVRPVEVAANAQSLDRFDVIGVTEKELGLRLTDRLRSVRELRRRLDEEGVLAPIHIFGSLDPIISALYAIAGADIFDGLTWLRYAMRDVPCHPDTDAATSLDWGLDPTEQKVAMLSRNIAVISEFQAALRLYRTTGDATALALPDGLVEAVESEVSSV